MDDRGTSDVRIRPQFEQNSPKTAARAAGNRRSLASWWRSIAGSVAASAGLFIAGISAEVPPVVAENSNYRSATAAPETWNAFARQLQGWIEQRLAGDDPKSRDFQDYLTRREGTGAPPLAVVLRTWVRSDGVVNRVEFDDIDDPAAVADLRALLIDANVGEPPPELLQPLHLRLSLRAKDPSRPGN